MKKSSVRWNGLSLIFNEKLTKAEEYQELIKRDLRKLDGEKQAYLFRKRELQRMIEDTRSMAIVCTAAVILCILILLALQFGLQMNTKIGYLAAAAAGERAFAGGKRDRKDHPASKYRKDPVCEQYPLVGISLYEI